MKETLNFKSYKCFSCNFESSKKTIYKKEAFNLNFCINQCDNCYSQFIDKIPQDVNTYKFIYDFGGRDSKTNLDSIFTKLRLSKCKRYLIKNCQDFLKSDMKILDYGSGDGYLSYTLKKINKDLRVDATDYFFEDNDFYKNINFFKIEDIFSNNQKYNLIILRHVLEHIEGPFEIINLLLEKLEPGGCILVEVPNHDVASNKLLKIFGKDYSQIGLPWHFNHFNKKDFLKNLPNRRIVFSKNSIPVFGQSLLMKVLPKKIFFENTGILALVFYPFQIIFDFVTFSFTALVVKIYKD